MQKNKKRCSESLKRQERIKDNNALGHYYIVGGNRYLGACRMLGTTINGTRGRSYKNKVTEVGTLSYQRHSCECKLQLLPKPRLPSRKHIWQGLVLNRLIMCSK